MKTTRLTWPRDVAPFAWIIAFLFFVITEALVILAERNQHLYSGHFLHFWLLPILCTAPLTVAINVKGGLQKTTAGREPDEAPTGYSAGVAMLVLTCYTVMASTVAVFL